VNFVHRKEYVERKDGETSVQCVYSFSAKTRKHVVGHVGAECRHDMRSSVQLPSVSDVDSKLGLAVVRPSLQLVPEPLALHPLPVSKHVRQICSDFLRFSTSDITLTFDLFN